MIDRGQAEDQQRARRSRARAPSACLASALGQPRPARATSDERPERAAARRVVSQIATPPPSGVGAWCPLCPPGRSMSPNRGAHRRARRAERRAQDEGQPPPGASPTPANSAVLRRDHRPAPVSMLASRPTASRPSRRQRPARPSGRPIISDDDRARSTTPNVHHSTGRSGGQSGARPAAERQEDGERAAERDDRHAGRAGRAGPSAGQAGGGSSCPFAAARATRRSAQCVVVRLAGRRRARPGSPRRPSRPRRGGRRRRSAT